MIEITGHRDKDGQRFINPIRTMTPSKAFEHLINELQFGAFVIGIKNLDHNNIRIITRVSFFGCTDEISFAGHEKDMRFLVSLATYHTIATSKSAAIKIATDLINKRLSSDKKGHPLLLSFLAGRAIGETLVRLSIILAIGITEDDDLELAVKANIKDVIAAAQLAHEGACSFREALNL